MRGPQEDLVIQRCAETDWFTDIGRSCVPFNASSLVQLVFLSASTPAANHRDQYSPSMLRFAGAPPSPVPAPVAGFRALGAGVYWPGQGAIRAICAGPGTCVESSKSPRPGRWKSARSMAATPHQTSSVQPVRALRGAGGKTVMDGGAGTVVSLLSRAFQEGKPGIA